MFFFISQKKSVFDPSACVLSVIIYHLFPLEICFVICGISFVMSVARVRLRMTYLDILITPDLFTNGPMSLFTNISLW